MSETDDVLSRDVTIAAKVEETGISIQAKSRAVAALDRLLGGMIDWPAAIFEGKASKQRLKDEVNRRLLEAQAEVAERKLKGLEQAGDALLVGVLKDCGRKQINVAGVVIEAVEEMKALPTPSEHQSGAEADEPGQVDEDWMNQFARFAEDASSDELQHLWGRVLAGEINQPGSFSRHTLRFIAELDKTTAEHCEFAMERSIGSFIPNDASWNETDHLNIGLDLQRLGVIEGLSGFDGFRQNFAMSSKAPQILLKGHRILVVHGQDGVEIDVPSIVVTRLGQEVFSLLTPKDPDIALRACAELLRTQASVRRIELGHWKKEGEGIRYFTDELIFERN